MATVPTPLLRSKLSPAAGPRQLLERKRLDLAPEFLDGSRSVALIAAPAGYGKSTLMGHWRDHLRARGLRTGWLSLDSDDQDPARLLRHLVAALQQAAPQLGTRALSPGAAGVTDTHRHATQALAADLETITARTVLLIDDLHFVAGTAGVEIINWLINYAPPPLQFVLACRQLPGLRLAGLRVRQRLFEVDAEALPFTLAEARDFCRARLGDTLSAADLGALVDKTEGWPAALELAALALRDGTDRSALVQGFAGTARGVVDYLGEAVLQGLDARLRRFLLGTAQFDRFDAALAAEATGEPQAAALLEELLARNLFLVPLDRDGSHYRYHHLAAEFFRARLLRDGGSPAEVLMRGARWLFARGQAEAAINAAIRAEDWASAARWIAESVEDLVYRRGYHHTIRRWMQDLPEAWVDRFPTIRFHYAFALTFFSEPNAVTAQVHHLERIRRRLRETPDADPALLDRVTLEIELQRVLWDALRDDGLKARDGARAWLERWPQAPAMRRGTMSNVYVLGLKAASEIDRGLEILAEGRLWLCQGEAWYGLSWNEYLTALLQLKRGALFEARRAAEAALTLLAQHLNGHPALTAVARAALAAIAYEFDELDMARQHLDLSMPRVAEDGHADAVLMGCLTEARLRRLDRDEAAGLHKLREGQEIGARRGFARVSLSLAAEECAWHLRAERLAEARLIAVRHGFDHLPAADQAPSLRNTLATRLGTRLRLREDPRAALAVVDAGLARCRALGLVRRTVELQVIRALAQCAQGEPEAARRSLEEALLLASPRGYVRTLLDFGPALAGLLDRLDPARLQHSMAAPLLRRLQQALLDQATAPARRRRPDPGPVEALSKREMTILRRLESGLDLEEIAESIFITKGTVKWHVQNIYGKLGVRNRSGAVARARSLSLI